MEKVAENGRKVKAIIALIFCCFFSYFSKIEKSAKIYQTVQ
jgi:hypothetical protein